MAALIPPELLRTGAVVAAVYAGWTLANNGTLGPGAQAFVQGITGGANQLATSATNAAGVTSPGVPKPTTTTTTAGGGNNAAGTGAPAGSPPSGFSHGGAQTSHQLTLMIAANPNFVSQAITWRQYRSGCCGQQFVGDPNSWGDFRKYEMSIGAPDPGYASPPEWLGPTLSPGSYYTPIGA